MYSSIAETDRATLFPVTAPTSVFNWGNDTLPCTVEAAEKRGKTVADAVEALYDADVEYRTEAWRGEMFAVAKANPGTPAIPLAYAGGIGRILEMHLKHRQTKAIAALCDEIALVAQQYSGDESVAVWHFDALWQHMRCLSRVEGLDAIRLCPLFKKYVQQYPASLALTEYRGRALTLSIKLQCQAVNDEGIAAPSSGMLLSLDAAADDYTELTALSRAFKSMELIRMQAEAAVRLCSASTGKPAEVKHWLDEAQKLYERFPGCEETVFAYIAGAGARIASLKNPDDLHEAERCLRKAEHILDSVHRDNVRLRKELLSDMLDLMAFYGRIGRPEAATHCVCAIIKGAQGLETEDQLRFTLTAMRQQVLGHLDSHNLQEAGNYFDLMCDYLGKDFRDWPGMDILVDTGHTLLNAHCRAAEFAEAEKVLNAIKVVAKIDRRIVQEAMERMKNMQQAYVETGLPELSNRGFLSWIGSTLSRITGTADKWRDELRQDREKSVTVMATSVRLVEYLLAFGMDIKALELYAFAREISELLPDDSELACGRMEAGMRLIEHYADAPSPRNVELLARELLDVAGRFPDVPVFLVIRTAVLVSLHRAHIMAQECDLAEEVLEELFRLHRQHRDNQTAATGFAAALNGQLLYHVALGQMSKCQVYFGTLATMYDKHPEEDIGQYLVDAGCVIGDFFLSRRMGNELTKLANAAGEQCRRHAGAQRVKSLWSNLENKCTMLNAVAV